MPVGERVGVVTRVHRFLVKSMGCDSIRPQVLERFVF